jgi:CBS domain-containing protein
MITCPFCNEQNIDGADECVECGQPLEFLSKPKPSSSLERSLVKDRVFMLGPRRPLTVDAATPVGDVLRKMVEQKIGCIVVVQDGDTVGIFTERDALMRLNADVAELAGQPVSRFMTPSPESIEADASIAFALHKMDIGGYRHMPVVSDGKTTGVISVRDVLRYITEDLMAAARG